MAEILLQELERFAAALVEAQWTLLDILRRKRSLLASSDLSGLETIQTSEAEAAQRLQTLVSWRAKLLEAARRAGRRCETITDLARSLNGPQNAAVLRILEAAQQLAQQLQQESWVHWVITNRCCNFYGEILELIAHGGRKPPTYQSADWVERGGAVLNASA